MPKSKNAQQNRARRLAAQVASLKAANETKRRDVEAAMRLADTIVEAHGVKIDQLTEVGDATVQLLEESISPILEVMRTFEAQSAQLQSRAAQIRTSAIALREEIGDGVEATHEKWATESSRTISELTLERDTLRGQLADAEEKIRFLNSKLSHENDTPPRWLQSWWVSQRDLIQTTHKVPQVGKFLRRLFRWLDGYAPTYPTPDAIEHDEYGMPQTGEPEHYVTLDTPS